jgi:phage gpG-like protein
MAEATLDISAWDIFIAELSVRNSKTSDYLKFAVETKGRQNVDEHFREQSGPNGAWAPRAASTQRAYANYASGKWKLPKGSGHATKYNPSNLLLQLTGRLKTSVQPAGKDGGVRVLDNHSVMLFSAVKYSRAHDLGNPSRGLPQREFMYLNDKGMEKVAEAFLGAFTEGL